MEHSATVVVRAPRALVAHLAKKQLLIALLRDEISGVMVHPESVAALLAQNASNEYPLLSVLMAKLLLPVPIFSALDPSESSLLSSIFGSSYAAEYQRELESQAPEGANQQQKRYIGARIFIEALGKELALYSNVTTGGNSKYVSRRDMIANRLVDNAVNILGKAILASEEAAFFESSQRKAVLRKNASTLLDQTTGATGTSTTISHSSQHRRQPKPGKKSSTLSALSQAAQFSSITVDDIETQTKKQFFRSVETHSIIITSILNGRSVTVRKDFNDLFALNKELVRKPTGTVPSLPYIDSYSTSKKNYYLGKINEYMTSLSGQPASSALKDFLGQFSIVTNSSISGKASQSISGDKTYQNTTVHAQSTKLSAKDSVTDEPIVLTEKMQDDLANVGIDEEDIDYDEDARTLIDSLEQFKSLALGPGGFKTLLSIISQTHDVVDLPLFLQRVIDWWIICAASTFHRTFITVERALDNSRRLKSFHKNAPYTTYIAILKSTNPVLIAKVLSNVFLAKPFGSQCLLQSTLSGVFKDEIETCKKEIDFYLQILAGQNGIANLNESDEGKNSDYYGGFANSKLVARVKEIVSNSPNAGYDPVEYPHKMSYILSKPIEQLDQMSVEFDAAEKILDIYWNIIRQEQLIDIIRGDEFVELVRAFIAISYKPLSEAYKIADPGSFIRDIQRIVTDLISVVNRLQGNILASINKDEPIRWPSLMPFINLLAKYKHRLYGDVRRTLSAHPSALPAFSEIGTYMDGLSIFLKGYGPPIDVMQTLQSKIENDSHPATKQLEIDPLDDPKLHSKLHRDILKLIIRKYIRNTRRFARMQRRLKGDFSGMGILEEDLPAQDANPFPNQVQANDQAQKGAVSNGPVTSAPPVSNPSTTTPAPKSTQKRTTPQICDYYISLGADFIPHHPHLTKKNVSSIDSQRGVKTADEVTPKLGDVDAEDDMEETDCGTIASPLIHVTIYPPGVPVPESTSTSDSILGLFDKRENSTQQEESNDLNELLDIVEFGLNVRPQDLGGLHGFKDGWNILIPGNTAPMQPQTPEEKKDQKGSFPQGETNKEIETRENAESRRIYNLRKIQLQEGDVKVSDETGTHTENSESGNDIDNVDDIIGEDINGEGSSSKGATIAQPDEKALESGLRSFFDSKRKTAESDAANGQKLPPPPPPTRALKKEPMHWKDELYLEYLPQVQEEFLFSLAPWIQHLWENGLNV